MLGRYLEIVAAVDGEFARNRELYGERIHCARGCTDCCSQLFQITEIEAAHISRGVQAMSAADRERLRNRARRYLEERRRLVAARGEQESWGNLPPPGTRLACPALEDGACRVYDFRPLICRKFGMPIFNPDKPGRLFACELNFRDGEEIADGDLVQIQTSIHERWKALNADYNRGGRAREGEPLTVARAITEDFSDLIE